MSILKSQFIKTLTTVAPLELIERLIDEYSGIKTQYSLGRYRPEELHGGRFAEVFLRILEHLANPTVSYTPLGTQINRPTVVSRIKNSTLLDSTLRLIVLPQIELLLDVRNRRDVAHVGGDVNPNYADSRLVCQLADWTLTELIRIYYSCSMNEAQKIVDEINQIKIPIIAEVEGFIRVQSTHLKTRQQTLAILYHKNPEKQRDTDLAKWIGYKNVTRYKSEILHDLHKEALIHYDETRGYCTLLPKGILYVEQNIPLDLNIQS